MGILFLRRCGFLYADCVKHRPFSIVIRKILLLHHCSNFHPLHRCDGIEDLNSYKRNIKAINQKADIVFETSEGEVDEIMEDDLPYCLDDEIIALDNQGVEASIVVTCCSIVQCQGSFIFL